MQVTSEQEFSRDTLEAMTVRLASVERMTMGATGNAAEAARALIVAAIEMMPALDSAIEVQKVCAESARRFAVQALIHLADIREGGDDD